MVGEGDLVKRERGDVGVARLYLPLLEGNAVGEESVERFGLDPHAHRGDCGHVHIGCCGVGRKLHEACVSKDTQLASVGENVVRREEDDMDKIYIPSNLVPIDEVSIDINLPNNGDFNDFIF